MLTYEFSYSSQALSDSFAVSSPHTGSSPDPEERFSHLAEVRLCCGVLLWAGQGSLCSGYVLRTAPSLADMGIAIKAVIAVGKGLEQNAGEDSVLLTEDDKLIQTCCWVTLR
eukprot:g31602.t1